MRLLVRRIYRAFPELDRYSDEQCRRFVRSANRGWRRTLHASLIALVVMGGVGLGAWLGDQAFSAANDYQVDRELQRSNHGVDGYAGIVGSNMQDQAVTESMGPIYDRTSEHLGTSDAMVIRTRKRLIDAAKDLRDKGTVPPGVDDPNVYQQRSGGVVLPKGVDWVEATKELRKAGVKHPHLTRDVLGGVPAV